MPLPPMKFNSAIKTKMWELLKDGHPVSRLRLIKCLWDDMGVDQVSSIWKHVSQLRTELINKNLDLVSRSIDGQICYVVVQYLVPIASK